MGKNSSKISVSKDAKENEAVNTILSRSGQGNMLMSSSSMNKRVSSAKGRKEKKEPSRRVIYERVNSK